MTLICDRFEYNALQPENHKVRVEGLQIINGGQTSKTVQATLNWLATLADYPGSDPDPGFEAVFVLVRLYQVPRDSTSFVQRITYATNSQNPVDLRDLRANDELQLRLEVSMKELGYEYRRQRAAGILTPKDISTATAAEAVLSVWRQRPQQAKFRSGEHFGKLYSDIFTPDLSAAQVVIAVLLFRIAENKRRRPPADAPELVRYASCYEAMLMGQYLLAEMGIQLSQLDHRNFARAQALIDEKGEAFFSRSVQTIEAALRGLYGGQQVSLQRLAATFRRGDLLQFLPPP
ncbi:AIPR family protein [Nannocystis sp.]|uniref:AIPR family protein n=1 Tax=Nannocystis sp. TaxID=1962667 RepID=UPI0025CBA10F|nr:AIPR family protein [Nannocystis sp.]